MSEKKPPDTSRPAQPQLQIQLDEATAQGSYVNLTLVNHTETEFVFDFVFVQPLDPRAKVRARIISSPKHAKRFLMALSENVTKYEARFGEVDASGPASPVH
ncbi:MAG: DUF3467 domain-containing protein [Myxococcota bacterium]